MIALKKVQSHPDIVDYFKEPKLKCLKNIDLLSELPFYEELNIIKTNNALREYAMSYKVEIVEQKRSTLSVRSK